MYSLTRKFTTTTATATTAGAAIRSLLKERDFAQIVSKFKQSSESYRFRSKPAVYKTIVSRLAAAKRFNSVKEILEDQKKYPNIAKEGFAVRLISLYGLAKMHDNACQLFDELPELKCVRTVRSFNALLSAHIDSKKYSTVEKLFREVPEKAGIVPDEYSYTILLQALCRKGSKEALDSVISVVDEMEEKGLKVGSVTYDVVLNGLYENGRFSDGEKVWERMGKRGVEYRVISYNARMKGLANEGRISEAEKLVEELKGKETKPDTFSYNVLIKGYCKEGKLEEAKRVYGDLLGSGCVANLWTYEVFVPALCDKGDLDFALQVTNKCLSSGCFMLYPILQRVVDGLVKQSMVDAAKKILELARSKGISRSKVKLPSEE